MIITDSCLSRNLTAFCKRLVTTCWNCILSISINQVFSSIRFTNVIFSYIWEYT